VRGGRAHALLLALLLAALGGCVSLPVSGPVTEGQAQQQPDDTAGIEYIPGGPKRGATEVDVVRGFLDAMTATPLSTFVARQFLTTETSSSWVPERRTLVYGSQDLAKAANGVRLTLRDTVALDGRGRWLGAPDGRRGATYRLDLVREQGEWRIDNPPDELIIPESHFEARYQQFFLYYFDKSGEVLVPEPVYLPRGAQAPTLLVSGLLRGPDRGLLGVERTFIPARTELGDISVPVSRDGTAVVPLTDEVLDLDDERLNLAFAQLAWTLAQVPGVEKMRVTVDGSPLDQAGERADQSVSGWSKYDPSVAWASRSLFGLRDGRVVAITGGEERRIPGPFGSLTYGLRSIGVDLAGEQVAGVTRSGGTVLVGSRDRAPGETPTASDATTVYAGGTDLLPPVYDITGQIWLVDRTEEGAALSVVRRGVARELVVPGITGRRVSSFLVSRDGTRVVAEVEHRGVDRLVVARVQRDHDGRVRRVLRAEPLPLGSLDVQEIRDVAWRTPGSVAVLAGPAPGTSQIIVVRVDGSSATEDLATDAEVFRDQAVRLVTSPDVGSPLYVGTRSGQLFALAANGRWTGTGIEPGLRSPTFVG
jgi:hypothetical protein